MRLCWYRDIGDHAKCAPEPAGVGELGGSLSAPATLTQLATMKTNLLDLTHTTSEGSEPIGQEPPPSMDAGALGSVQGIAKTR